MKKLFFSFIVIFIAVVLTPLHAFCGLGMNVELADEVARAKLQRAYDVKKGELMDYWYNNLKITHELDFEEKWSSKKYYEIIDGLHSEYLKNKIKKRDLSRIGDDLLTDSLFYIFKNFEKWSTRFRK